MLLPWLLPLSQRVCSGARGEPTAEGVGAAAIIAHAARAWHHVTSLDARRPSRKCNLPPLPGKADALNCATGAPVGGGGACGVVPPNAAIVSYHDARCTDAVWPNPKGPKKSDNARFSCHVLGMKFLMG